MTFKILHANQLHMIDLLNQINGNVTKLLKQEGTLMAAIDDLNAAVATLSTNFTAADTAIQAEIKALTAALAADDSTAVEAAATNISAISAKMATDTAALVASIPPAPAPAPAPAPVVGVGVAGTKG